MAKAASATTVRLQPKIQSALVTLGKIRHMTMNKLVNEALEVYLDQNLTKAKEELKATLSDLHAYLDRDPDLDKSVEMFVKSESKNPDPIKTRIVRKGRATAARGRRAANA